MVKELSGSFFRIIFECNLDMELSKGTPDRPAGRYNRPGQNALYLSKSAESAKVALRKYLKSNDPCRVLVQYEVSCCQVLDLRHPDAEELLLESRSDWSKIYSQGGVPGSWGVADRIRAMGHDGLIDPSRKDPDSWHLVLFRWNEAAGVTVEQTGQPVPIQFD